MENNMEAPDLLPCPFCDESAYFEGGVIAGYKVKCAKCLATGPWGDYEYRAADRWNRRADLHAPSSPAEVEGLVGGETRTLAVDAVWKPCVHGGGWWIAKNADGGDVLLSSDTPQAAPAQTALQAEIERLRLGSYEIHQREKAALARAEKAEGELAKLKGEA